MGESHSGVVEYARRERGGVSQSLPAAADLEKKQALEMEKVKFRPKFEAMGMTAGRGREDGRGGGKPAARREASQGTTDYISKTGEIAAKWKRIGEEATAIQVKPRKVDVHITHFGLGARTGERPAA